MARYVGDWLKRADKAVWKRLAHWGDGRWTLILTALMLLLMVRQTVVIEKQDEILGRRAKLTAVITEERRDTEGVSFLVSVENGGRKAAQSFYYTLLMITV